MRELAFGFHYYRQRLFPKHQLNTFFTRKVVIKDIQDCPIFEKWVIFIRKHFCVENSCTLDICKK